MTDLIEQPPFKKLYDRVYINFNGLKYTSNYPLCEILDGNIEEINDRVIKMKQKNGSTTLYERKVFVETINRLVSENREITALWIQREGSRTKERII